MPLPLARSKIAQFNYKSTFAQNYVKTIYRLSRTFNFCSTQNYLHICTGSVSVAQGSDIFLSSGFSIGVFLIGNSPSQLLTKLFETPKDA